MGVEPSFAMHANLSTPLATSVWCRHFFPMVLRLAAEGCDGADWELLSWSSYDSPKLQLSSNSCVVAIPHNEGEQIPIRWRFRLADTWSANMSLELFLHR